MSKFWRAYASVTDDVRHTLVEEAWFGRRVTGDINERDMPALAPDHGQPANNFYGESRAAETPANSFYGSSPAPGAGASSLYGNGPAAPTTEDATAPPGRQEGPEPGF